MTNEFEYCIDCGRKTNGRYCTRCGLPICNQCIRDKHEILCDDDFNKDNLWMEDDENYLDG